MSRMMPEVDTAELPDELFDVEIAAKVLESDGALNQLGQQASPLSFHFEDLVPDAPLDVIELEQAGSHRTSSRQTRALGPSEPVANERLQPRKTFAGSHRRFENMHRRELCHMRQQFDLNVLFRPEVREQSALRHSDLVSQNPKSNPGQPGLAHQGQSLMEYPFTRRCFRPFHCVPNSTTGRILSRVASLDFFATYYVIGYIGFRDSQFTHKGLRKFFETGSSAGIRPEHNKRLRLILGVLNAAVTIQDISLPALGLHRLSGRLSGFWSVSVSGNWRVIFRFEEGEALDVDYLDYH